MRLLRLVVDATRSGCAFLGGTKSVDVWTCAYFSRVCNGVLVTGLYLLVSEPFNKRTTRYCEHVFSVLFADQVLPKIVINIFFEVGMNSLWRFRPLVVWTRTCGMESRWSRTRRERMLAPSKIACAASVRIFDITYSLWFVRTKFIPRKIKINKALHWHAI